MPALPPVPKPPNRPPARPSAIARPTPPLTLTPSVIYTTNMSHTATLTAGLASPPDPPRDRNARPMPARIAEVLDIAGILAAYGRHLADTIEHRALWRGFATIAQFFGTASLAFILPHLRRGIMRA